MCDFSHLDPASKNAYHLQLMQCVDAFGGKNFFLQLIESLRGVQPHPLLAKNCTFRMAKGTVTWNKAIYQSTLNLLLSARLGESTRGNLLPDVSDKSYKNVMNLVRTLKPLTFVVTPKNPADGAGFSCSPFELIDAQTTRLDPLFDALFFCSVDTVKKVLNYTPAD